MVLNSSKSLVPDDTLYIPKHNGEWVAMEYGTTEGEEFHSPIVSTSKRLIPDEAMFIVEAWTYVFVEVTLILKQVTHHRQQGFGNFDNSPDIVSK